MKAVRRAVLVLLLGVFQPCFGEELTAEKRADIEELLSVTGARNLASQMASALVANMAQSLKQKRPDIPQHVLDAMPGEVEAVFRENMASLEAQVIPLYHKYFTAEEIKGMLRFYSTELGKKTIQVLPALMGESIAAGQNWGAALGPEIEARIRARFKKEGIAL